jgi:hypothetical protein
MKIEMSKALKDSNQKKLGILIIRTKKEKLREYLLMVRFKRLSQINQNFTLL